MIDYQGVLGICSYEYIVSKSRFIATVSNVSSHEEATEFIKEISKRYSNATHNCYAYIANPEMTEMKFSDAGEPQGTAGQPMLEVLRKKTIACTCVVVSRYFGGVKLGTGGLVNAYTRVTKECLERANIVKFILSDYILVKADYTYESKIEKAILNNGGDVVDTIYLEDVEITYAVPVERREIIEKAILAITSGQIEEELLYRKYYIFK